MNLKKTIVTAAFAFLTACNQTSQQSEAVSAPESAPEPPSYDIKCYSEGTLIFLDEKAKSLTYLNSATQLCVRDIIDSQGNTVHITNGCETVCVLKPNL